MQLLLFPFVVFLFLTSSSAANHKTFQLIFPQNATTPYAKLHGTIAHKLNEFTLCHWTKRNIIDSEAFFLSYAVGSPAVDFILINFNEFDDAVDFTRMGYDSVPWVKYERDPWDWLHMCTVWSTVRGSWIIYLNGERAVSGNNIAPNKPVTPNGKLILGKEVRDANSEDSRSKPFIGQVTELHLWNYVLTANEIQKLYTCTFQGQGNVISWNRESWSLYYGAKVSAIDMPCEPRLKKK